MKKRQAKETFKESLLATMEVSEGASEFFVRPLLSISLYLLSLSLSLSLRFCNQNQRNQNQ